MSGFCRDAFGFDGLVLVGRVSVGWVAVGRVSVGWVGVS